MFRNSIAFEKKESLGIAYIASSLINSGHKVDLIDAQFNNWDIDFVLNKIEIEDYDIIGFSLFQETMESFDKLYYKAEEYLQKHFVVVGGHYASFTSEELLRRYGCIDAVSIGEGEITFLELAEKLESGRWKTVEGICYLENNKLCYTPRKLIEDLDSIPYPYRDPYFLNNKDNNKLSATISASRGCYANCGFCSIQSFYGRLPGKSIRIRSAKAVVAEMGHIAEKYNINKFFFADDNFLTSIKIDKTWIDTFINEIRNRNIKCSFDIDCRVNDIDSQLFLRLKEVGLNGVFLGVENFNQRMLDTLNKNVRVEDNKRAIKILHRLRVNVWMGFIMFDMFTTLEEILENIAALEEINYFKYYNYDRPLSSDWLSSPLLLYNGTPLLERMKKEYPELLNKTKFGYEYKFLHYETTVFYNALLKWKRIINEMIQLDTLNLIKIANRTGKVNEANQLHHLSRQYMKVDKECYLHIIEWAQRGGHTNIDGILKYYADLMNPLKKQILCIKNELLF